MYKVHVRWNIQKIIVRELIKTPKNQPVRRGVSPAEDQVFLISQSKWNSCISNKYIKGNQNQDIRVYMYIQSHHPYNPLSSWEPACRVFKNLHFYIFSSFASRFFDFDVNVRCHVLILLAALNLFLLTPLSLLLSLELFLLANFFLYFCLHRLKLLASVVLFCSIFITYSFSFFFLAATLLHSLVLSCIISHCSCKHYLLLFLLVFSSSLPLPRNRTLCSCQPPLLCYVSNILSPLCSCQQTLSHYKSSGTMGR